MRFWVRTAGSLAGYAGSQSCPALQGDLADMLYPQYGQPQFDLPQYGQAAAPDASAPLPCMQLPVAPAPSAQDAGLSSQMLPVLILAPQHTLADLHRHRLPSSQTARLSLSAMQQLAQPTGAAAGAVRKRSSMAAGSGTPGMKVGERSDNPLPWEALLSPPLLGPTPPPPTPPNPPSPPLHPF